jgi:prepilin-type N-terminal cleavage/methylation domain-containing protein
MTLETGKHNKSSSRCAFTLIELVMVMALLVVAVCLVAPRMSDFIRGRALDSEARRLMALMHAGQARAVSEGMPMVLWMDEKQGSYGLQQETPPKGEDPKAEQLTMSDSVHVVPAASGASSLTTFRNLPAIRFLPDGTIDENSPQTVKLAQDNSQLWLVELQNHTGYEISDSSK